MDIDLNSLELQLENDRLLTKHVMADSKLFRLYEAQRTSKPTLLKQEKPNPLQQTGGQP